MWLLTEATHNTKGNVTRETISYEFSAERTIQLQRKYDADGDLEYEITTAKDSLTDVVLEVDEVTFKMGEPLLRNREWFQYNNDNLIALDLSATWELWEEEDGLREVFLDAYYTRHKYESDVDVGTCYRIDRCKDHTLAWTITRRVLDRDHMQRETILSQDIVKPHGWGEDPFIPTCVTTQEYYESGVLHEKTLDNHSSPHHTIFTHYVYDPDGRLRLKSISEDSADSKESANALPKVTLYGESKILDLYGNMLVTKDVQLGVDPIVTMNYYTYAEFEYQDGEIAPTGRISKAPQSCASEASNSTSSDTTYNSLSENHSCCHRRYTGDQFPSELIELALAPLKEEYYQYFWEDAYDEENENTPKKR